MTDELRNDGVKDSIILCAALADVLERGEGYWQQRIAGVTRDIIAQAGDVSDPLREDPRKRTALRELRTELALAMREPLPDVVPGETY